MKALLRPLRAYLYRTVALAALCLPVCFAQDCASSRDGDTQAQAQTAGPESSLPAPPAAGQEQEPPGGNRVFGVLPNYRTASACEEGTAIDSRAKIRIALKDSFDWPLILLSGALAGLGQLTDQDPSFGQGVEGYAHRLATNYADQAMGNMFTEGFFPVLFHQDPRYFQRGQGRKWYRAGYALSRVIVTDSDSGHLQFNYSEWLGNATAVAISNAYYPDNRNVSGNVYKLLEQVGTDAASQVLKEFWPDIKHKLFHRGLNEQPCGAAIAMSTP